jgi:conjugal transfer pilus assembly protein TraW
MNKALLFLLAVNIYAGSINIISTGGATFNIKERNVAELLEEHIQKNKEKIEKKLTDMKPEMKKQLENYKPRDLTKNIVSAKENKVHYPDPTYTTKEDVKDAGGNILYPKGYKFNPLHYISLTDKYVFFNYSNKKEVEWIKTNKLDKDITTRLIITDGKIFEAMKELEREVFYANDLILDRFEINATPSIAMQQGDRIVVSEFLVQNNKKEKQ